MLFKVIYGNSMTEWSACWGPILHEKHYEQWLREFNVPREQYILASVFDQEKLVKLPYTEYGHKEPTNPKITGRHNIIVFHKFSDTLTTAFGLFSYDKYSTQWIKEYSRQQPMREGIYRQMYMTTNHTFRGT